MDNLKMLQYAINEGMIDLEQLQLVIASSEREKCLKRHKYTIWQGKNGRWNTHLPTPRGLKRVIRVKREDLENAIFDFYTNGEENPTIEELYNSWMNARVDNGEILIQTKQRYDNAFKRFSDDFKYSRIKNIDEYDIETFIIREIKSQNMTRRNYANFCTIIYGIFKYARKKKYIFYSITDLVDSIDINKRMFRLDHKEDSDLVFTLEEKSRIEDYINSNCPDIKGLGILLLFKTGMRPGELVGLKWSDIGSGFLTVQRTEVSYCIDGKRIYEVRDFPKTEAGIRNIVLPESALEIIERVRQLNPNGNFVFESNGKRLKVHRFSYRLRKICHDLGIKYRSLNKIRKTYATLLLDNRCDELFIIQQMGHTDIRTTKGYYYKNMKSLADKEVIINSVVGL